MSRTTARKHRAEHTVCAVWKGLWAASYNIWAPKKISSILEVREVRYFISTNLLASPPSPRGGKKNEVGGISAVGRGGVGGRREEWIGSIN